MENQFYQMYLDELSEIPECTNEEMEALLNSLPNEEAVKRLTEGSLAYVVREAAKYAGNDVEISDLVQEGNMALLLVLKNYASHPVVGDDAVSYFNQLRERAVHMAMEAVTEEQKQSEQTAEKLTASVNVLNVVMTKLAEELGIRKIKITGGEPLVRKGCVDLIGMMQMSEDEVQAVMKEAINAVAVDRSEAAQKEDEALENQ